MAYCKTKNISGSLGEVEKRVRESLSKHGFGVLTEIDVEATLQNKIGAQVGPYKILGACNPTMAKGALDLEPRIGVMLPCNVILRGAPEGQTEVSVIDPVASMAAVDNADLKAHAEQVRNHLNLALDELPEAS